MLPALKIASARLELLRAGAVGFRIFSLSSASTAGYEEQVPAEVAPTPCADVLSSAPIPEFQSTIATEPLLLTHQTNHNAPTKTASEKKMKPNLVARFHRMITASKQCWKKKPKRPAKKAPPQAQKAEYAKWKAEFDAHEAWGKDWWWVKKCWNLCAKQTMQQEELPVGETLRIMNRCKVGGYVNHILLLFLVEKLMADPTALDQFDAMRVSMAVNSLGMMARDSRDVGDWDKDAAWGKYVKKKHDDSANPANARTKKFFEKTCLKFIDSVLAHATKQSILPDALDLRDCGSIVHGLGLLYPTEEYMRTVKRDTPTHIKEAVASMVEKFGQELSAGRIALPINMSCLLHGCANVHHKGNLQPICSAVLLSLQKGEEFTEQQVANIVWALGKLHQGEQELFDLLMAQIVDKVEWIIPQGLANIVYGLGLRQGDDVYGLGLGGPGVIVPENVVEVLIQEVGKPHRLPRFAGQDLYSMVFGFERLGLSKDSNSLQKLQGEINRRDRGRYDPDRNSDKTRQKDSEVKEEYINI